VHIPADLGDDRALLDLLGVTLPAYRQAPVERFKLWQENETAYFIFVRVANHGQWQRNPNDPNQLLGIDGAYLLQYLQATQPPPFNPDLLDDVHSIVEGFLRARNE